jgi:hypothetical protein
MFELSLNYLLPGFLECGVCTAISAFQFNQYSKNDTRGWSIRRLGYLSEVLFDHADGPLRLRRGEEKPQAAKYLATNLAVYFRRSLTWLKANGSSPQLDAE